MTPEEALAALARLGWRWHVDAKHSTTCPTSYQIAGWGPWATQIGADISVFIYGQRDLAAAVAWASAEAERLTAEHAYDPYASVAA